MWSSAVLLRCLNAEARVSFEHGHGERGLGLLTERGTDERLEIVGADAVRGLREQHGDLAGSGPRARRIERATSALRSQERGPASGVIASTTRLHARNNGRNAVVRN